METALFAAGCFWGVQSAFDALPGVVSTDVGYAGGHHDSPTYEDVCAGVTGHAETLRVVFDPEKISYKTLVEKFFELHDPTQVDRQGPDVGSQYRSAIFTLTPSQAETAQKVKDELTATGAFKRPIVTIITAEAKFWKAEDYHQKYFEKRGGGACHVKIS